MHELMSWFTGLIAAVIPGFGEPAVPQWSGYVEADYVYVGAVTPGAITEMAAEEGAPVRRGQVLFVLVSNQQKAALEAAEARVAAAEATLENLTTGSRKEEIDVIRASLDKANADLSLAKATFERSKKLMDQGLITRARFDQDAATLASAEAQVAQLDAQLKVSELPARDAQQLAAEANLLVAKADAERARSDLADRTITAPADGFVERLYFAEGEQVPAGTPVMSLLPNDALKVKFYVGETDRPTLSVGDVLTVTCDGCTGDLTATLSYFAADPQFTPPVIYSRDERNRLTFLAEAVVDNGASLPPGQPVTVVRMDEQPMDVATQK
jgi:HlyD family secretion protein